jgi:hypothetical protein
MSKDHQQEVGVRLFIENIFFARGASVTAEANICK